MILIGYLKVSNPLPTQITSNILRNEELNTEKMVKL